jgi:hypothetical protein
LVGRLVGWSVRPSVCPHDEILQNLFTWKTGYVAIASRRGEGRGNQLMSKTGYVKIASRLVTVARSCLKFSCFPPNNEYLIASKPRNMIKNKRYVRKKTFFHNPHLILHLINHYSETVIILNTSVCLEL